MTDAINEKLADPIAVKTSKTQPIAMAFLALFFIPIGLWSLFQVLTEGFSLVPAVIATLIFGSCCITLFLFYKGWQLMPKKFDRDGITRKDGKIFLWSDIENVEHQYYVSRYSPKNKGVWRVNVCFKDGLVWLVPMKIKNFSEIYPIVLSLPCEHTEKTFHGTAYN